MKKRVRHRGVGVLVCVVLIGVIAAVLTAVSGSARAEASRTTAQIDDAQTSQLVRAALVIAADEVRNGHPVDGPIPTPIGTVRLSWLASTTADHRCTIDVTMPTLKRSVRCVIRTDGSISSAD